jgi:hypothetical protein
VASVPENWRKESIFSDLFFSENTKKGIFKNLGWATLRSLAMVSKKRNPSQKEPYLVMCEIFVLLNYNVSCSLFYQKNVMSMAT